jgi:ABC-type transport system substrate-binding protein
LSQKNWKGILQGGAGSTVADPDGQLWRLLGGNGLYDAWEDEEFDKLGNEARYSLDSELRRKNYVRMNDIALEKWPWIPLFLNVRIFGMAKTIDWQFNPSIRVDFRKDNLKFVG